MWSEGPRVCFCLPEPPSLFTCSSGFSLEWGSKCGPGSARTSGQRRREVITSWSCCGKLKKSAQCTRHLASGWPCPFYYPPRPSLRQTGTPKTDAAAGLQVFLEGEERNRRCCLTPLVPKPQLTLQSSVAWWQSVRRTERVRSEETSG